MLNSFPAKVTWSFNIHSTHKYVRFEVLTALKMTMLLFWIMTLCSLVGTNITAFLGNTRRPTVFVFPAERRLNPEGQHRQLKNKFRIVIEHKGLSFTFRSTELDYVYLLHTVTTYSYIYSLVDSSMYSLVYIVTSFNSVLQPELYTKLLVFLCVQHIFPTTMI
jgi:hypothetical protein